MVWNRKNLWNLRRQISLGSYLTKDYRNSFGVKEEDACSFFDAYQQWLYEEDKQDTSANLKYFYDMYCDEPLPIKKTIVVSFDLGEEDPYEMGKEIFANMEAFCHDNDIEIEDYCIGYGGYNEYELRA